MSWQPFHWKKCKTHTLPHHATERQRSVNNISYCILCNQGFVRINELITELLTAYVAKNATYKRKHRYSKIINVTDCKTCKKWLLAVECLILMIYSYPTAKTRPLYISTDGPAGRPADNPAFQTGWEICIEPDPNWRFLSVDNPDHQYGNGSFLTQTRTRSDRPEPSLTLMYCACLQEVAKTSFSENAPCWLVWTLLSGEIFHIARYGPYGEKLCPLCQRC